MSRLRIVEQTGKAEKERDEIPVREKRESESRDFHTQGVLASLCMPYSSCGEEQSASADGRGRGPIKKKGDQEKRPGRGVALQKGGHRESLI